MKKIFCVISILLGIVSCGPAIYVDYEKGKDFSEYSTYQFYPEINSGLNELDTKRIKKAIDSVFAQKGYTKTDYNRFYIDFHVQELVINSKNTVGIGIGGTGRNVGVGLSGGIPIGGARVNQQLTIDFIDASQGNALVWQAVIEGELKEKATPQQKEAYYYQVIAKALKKFPPK